MQISAEFLLLRTGRVQQCTFQTAPLGDVVDDRPQVLLPVVGGKHRAIETQRYPAAILAYIFLFVRSEVSRARCELELSVRLQPVFWVGQLSIFQLSQLIGTVTRQTAKRLVELEIASIGVRKRDADVGGFVERPELELARAQSHNRLTQPVGDESSKAAGHEKESERCGLTSL